jgi:hypothetical protein
MKNIVLEAAVPCKIAKVHETAKDTLYKSFSQLLMCRDRLTMMMHLVASLQLYIIKY